jgi:hypothetical protein
MVVRSNKEYKTCLPVFIGFGFRQELAKLHCKLLKIKKSWKPVKTAGEKPVKTAGKKL